MGKLCSVIIPIWIRNDEIYDLTRRTLDSFSNAENAGLCEFVLIDNASPIGGDLLQSLGDTYVRNSVNLGYPKAVNQGIKLATTDLVVIANNDIRVSPNWLKVTVNTLIHKKMSKAGTLHFKMVEYNSPFNLGDEIWATGRERWCHGSFFVAKKKLLEKIGLYDEGYGLGGYDDWDLQYRVREAGYETAYTNAAAFQHKDSSTQNTLEDKARAESDNKNREYFKKKFGRYPEVIFEDQFGEQLKRPWRPFP
jgi:O-antigen biosynthesis protein